jgi:hypothetical protein
MPTLMLLCIAAAAALHCGCAGPYAVGYAIDPVEGPPIKYNTPVLVRPFADQRPRLERFEPADAGQYSFYSSDIWFKEDVAASITRAFQHELANAGIEVAAEGNHLLGNKPYLRLTAEVVHFIVTRKPVPVATMQDKVDTLWLRDQFSVRVALRVNLIDTKSEKKVMQRYYESSDSFTQRAGMIDVEQYKPGSATPPKKTDSKTADNDYCIQLLNKHLKIVLVQARQDIVQLLTP